MSMTASSSRFRLNGWHVLAIMVGFFAVVIGVDASFAVMAYKTFPGQVSVTPYEDGVAYNSHLAQMNAQARLGWKATASVTPAGEVAVAVRDADGAAVTGLKASGKFERPATEQGRLTPAFHEKTPGLYVADLGREHGAWDLSFEAVNTKGDRFVATRRLTWP